MCVSTAKAGSPNACDITTLAVLWPTPGRRSSPSMRSSIFFLAGVLAAGVGSFAGDLSVPHPAPTAECTYSRAAEAARSGPAVWHRVSAAAELAAPTATDAGRHRPSAPPKGDPPAFTAVNFVDTEVFGKMVKDGVRWTTASGDTEFLRRITLDLTGEIPSSDDVKAFLADTSPDKRTK